MKNVFSASVLVFFFILFIGANRKKEHVKETGPLQREIISCGLADGDGVAGEDGKFIPLLPGWGNHNYTISTSSDSAQIYFNQGLSFYFGYHFREARASFKEAARFDKNCAMAYWGLALAMGPYYNNFYYKMSKDVPAVMEKMSSNAAAATEKEQALIKALQQRYSGDTTNKDRPILDSNYAAALKSLIKLYPADDDIKALYVDAVMLQHKWDFWDTDGNAKPWTPELLTICETILLRQRTHPAALHYYIHLTEASRQPQLALHSADVLKDAMPGVGHMVHMATHSYQRNGLYLKGVAVNEDANIANNKVDDLAPNLGIGKDKIVHVYNVQSFCAINAGMYSKAQPLYMRARSRLLALSGDIKNETHDQDIFMLPVTAMVRTGKWNEILQAPAPDSNWKYAVALDDFAKGLALVRTKDLNGAKQRLTHLESIMKDNSLAIRVMPFNAPFQLCRIAAGILKGEMSFAEGKNDDAIKYLNEAVEEEDKLIYREPQEWILPVRQYLGLYLLKTKQPAAAEKIYRKDLELNPANGWSTVGMYQSLLAQGKKGEATLYKDNYVNAFKDADEIPAASVY